MSIADQKIIVEIPDKDPEGFVQRQPATSRYEQAGIERRQFPNAGVVLSEEGQELERAIDIYKMMNQKKKINSDELIAVIRAIGFDRVHGFKNG